ncbi:MAG: polysaccharide pyruvyl transferase CsaB [Negativicutes bacterium]|jgi:polysaccharide pyruvyl transferase CsaB|nr:polysaccharide pyruvyl transferase CsaB [Negativicutes bacterium]
MSEIVLSGYYGFGNAGDEAMLLSILEAIERERPGSSVTVISGRPEDTEKKYQVKAVHRFDYIGMIGALRKADLLLSGGGSLLQDVTSRRSIFYYLSIIKLAQWLKVPTMLFAQGIGPVVRPTARKALCCVVNQVDLITVRDEKSRSELIELGVTKPPIHVTADPVLSLKPESGEYGEALLEKIGYVKGKKLIGFAIRDWPLVPEYLDEIAKTADLLLADEEVQLVFLPMQWPEDGQVARKVQEKMSHQALFLEGEYRVREHLSVIAQLDLLVGVRLHGLIFAFLSATPCIGLSYDPKINSFLELIGETSIASLENLRSDELARAIWAKLEEAPTCGVKRREELHFASEKNAKLMASLLS